MTEDPIRSAEAEANSDSEADATRHRDKMARKKAARDRMAAGRTDEKGLVIVHTGTGKGKSTAAWGMVLRCLGHGFPVAVVQFIKGARDTAEREVLARFPDLVTVTAIGEGFTWETQDRARDEANAARAWAEARAALQDPECRMVVLDEVNVVLRYGYLDLDMVLSDLAARPEGQHVVLTGRGAPDPLIEAADLVTEMKLIKHPYRSGIKGQPGVEF